MIKAFIFDLDGTLVDTELVWAEAVATMLKDRGYDSRSDEILHLVFGRAWGDIYLELLTHFPRLKELSAAELGDELRDYYLRLREDGKNTIITTSARLLRQLAAAYPVIIVSGSPRADILEAVALLEVEDCVRFVLGSEDYSPGKPHPAGFLLGAAKLGISPEACLVFEDSRAGVMAAKAAGMSCVALKRPSAYQQDLSVADLILEDLAHFDLARWRNEG